MNLDTTLTELETEQLLRRLKEQDIYSFKHSLTQETVYQGLLKSQRRALHRAIAQAIEEIYADRKGKLSDVLAYHWEIAEVPDRARRYLLRAAQNALRSYANQEALNLLTRALAQCQDAKPQDVMALREMRAQVFESLDQSARALEDYQAALPLARQAHRLIDESRLLSRLAWSLLLCGKSEQAMEVAQQAEKLALEQQDHMGVLRSHMVRGLAEQARGQLVSAQTRIRAALLSSQTSGQAIVEGECWYYLGVQYDLMGRYARAVVCARQARTIKNGLSDPVGEILALYLQARAQGARGHYDAALEALEQGRALAEKISNPYGLADYAHVRAWLAAQLGDWQTAYEFDRAGLDAARRAAVRSSEISTLLNLFLDCVMLGNLDEAETYCQQLTQWLGRPEQGYRIWRWHVRYNDARARLLMAQASYDQVAGVIAELIDQADQTHSNKYCARGLVLRARIDLQRGEAERARIDLLAACHLADEMSHTPARIETRQWLARAVAQSDPVQAQAYLAQADQIVQSTGESLIHPELKRSFERGLGSN